MKAYTLSASSARTGVRLRTLTAMMYAIVVKVVIPARISAEKHAS